jgi:hypothetical protein
MANEICKCGHFKQKHATLGMGTKELMTVCRDCCPTDFNEHYHTFTPDNLAYLEWQDEQRNG